VPATPEAGEATKKEDGEEPDVLEASGGEGWGLAEVASKSTPVALSTAPANASNRCGARASSEDERPPDSSPYQSKIENENDEPVVPVARLVMAIGAQTNQKGDHRKDESTLEG
jgi:hypothetical protein